MRCGCNGYRPTATTHKSIFKLTSYSIMEFVRPENVCFHCRTIKVNNKIIKYCNNSTANGRTACVSQMNWNKCANFWLASLATIAKRSLTTESQSIVCEVCVHVVGRLHIVGRGVWPRQSVLSHVVREHVFIDWWHNSDSVTLVRLYGDIVISSIAEYIFG